MRKNKKKITENEVLSAFLLLVYTGADLITFKKKPLKIISLGVYHPHDGPDFQNCVILYRGFFLYGDIEVDPEPKNWFSHGHSRNLSFNRVILQVSSLTFPERAVLPLKPPLHLILPAKLCSDLYFRIRRNEKEPDPELLLNLLPCRPALMGRHLIEWLQELGLKRLQSRLKRFEAYRDKTGCMDFQAVLFISLCPEENGIILRYLYPGIKKYLNHSWKSFSGQIRKLMARTGKKWDLRKLRPKGRPEQRLRWFHGLIHSGLIPGLLLEIEQIVFRTSAKELPVRFYEMMRKTGAGSQFSDYLLVNVLFPYLILQKRETEDFIISLWKVLPGLEKNRKIIRFKYFRTQAVLNGENVQQGLICLYDRHCLQFCRSCPICGFRALS